MKFTEEVTAWFGSGANNFDDGFKLLEIVSTNRFHLDNVKRRRDLESVRHELNKLYYALGGKVKLEIKRVALPVKKVLAEVDQKNGKIKEKIAGALEVVTGAIAGGTGVVTGGTGAVVPGTGAVTGNAERVPVVLVDPVKVKNILRDERVVLRSEFPFLAEPGCPEEFKILVADMITAHGRYVKGHDRLFDVVNKGNEKCFEVARDTVENYIDNREMWDELEYYKKTGEVLGKHRVFTDRKMRAKIMAMGEDELEKFMMNINRRRLYREKMIADGAGNEKVFDWKKDIEELDRMKQLVKSWGVNSRDRRGGVKKKK